MFDGIRRQNDDDDDGHSATNITRKRLLDHSLYFQSPNRSTVKFHMSYPQLMGVLFCKVQYIVAAA